MIGIWGLAGYPLQGLHIHIRRSLAKTSARETVISSRLAQGMQEMEKLSDEEREAIRRKWRELQGIEGVNGVE